MIAPRTIVITGASSGIGAELALAYAAPGILLGLLARDTARLAEVARRCRDRGATVEDIVADVTDREAMAHELRAFDNRHAIDLAIVNAGVSQATASIGDLEAFDAILATNVSGAINTVAPVLEAMCSRCRGQIALMGSLGARIGIASSPAYSMSKAALETYGLALRSRVSTLGVEVSVISPGFVRSPMSDRVEGGKPFLVSAERAAQIIRRGLAANRARIAFPLPLALAASLLSALPYDFANRLVRPFSFRVRG